MLVSKKEYNKEITIDKNVIKEIHDFFTNKIVIASKDISCYKATIELEEKKTEDGDSIIGEYNEKYNFNTTEKVFLLKGSSIRIRFITSGSGYLRFYCECCNDNGEIELVCIDKPMTDEEKQSLIFKKTLPTPLSAKNQKILDSMPSPEKVVSDLFTTNLVLLQKSEEFNARCEVRKKKLKRHFWGGMIGKILGVFGTLACGVGLVVSKSDNLFNNPTSIAGNELSESTLNIMNTIDGFGAGICMGVLALLGWLGLIKLIECLTDNFVSKKRNIWHKLYKIFYGRDYKEAERNEDLYNVMNKEELYNLENVSIDSIEDKRPRLLSVGKIRKEKYKKNLELYRTVDKDNKEVFEFPDFPKGIGEYENGTTPLKKRPTK